MPKLPRIPALIVVKALRKAGFYEFHQSGSHIQFKHFSRTELRVTIPYHKKDLAPKTLKSIIAQAGITVDAFIDLL